MKALLAWVARWRAVPVCSPSLEGEVKEKVRKAREWKLLKLADSLVGPVVGLTEGGAREVGQRGASLARTSVKTASLRAVLHLAAHRLPGEVRVVGFERHYVLVEAGGEPRRLGWGGGDIVVGPLGSDAPFPVALPKQLALSEHDLTDEEWSRVFLFAVEAPALPFRSRYWARTLLDAALALEAFGYSFVRERGGDLLVYAAYRFIKRRPEALRAAAREVPRVRRLLRA